VLVNLIRGSIWLNYLWLASNQARFMPYLTCNDHFRDESLETVYSACIGTASSELFCRLHRLSLTHTKWVVQKEQMAAPVRGSKGEVRRTWPYKCFRH